MALTFGFYNSLNHDRRYNAEQMSSIFNGIINDGVFQNIGTAMVVTAGSGLVVNVGIGRAWFNSTWTYNDAILPITADVSDLLLDRYDAVVLEVNSSESVRANQIFIKKGTPSANPVKPEMTNTNEVHQHVICYIYRKADSSEIVQSDIENRVGTSDFPFVTGILSTIATDELVKQWESGFNSLVNSKSIEFDKLLTQLRNNINESFEGKIPDSVVYGESTDETAEVVGIDASYLGGSPASAYAKQESLNQTNVNLDNLSKVVDTKTYIKKLWTNASPSTVYSSQKVSLDLSEYDAVIITHCKSDRSGTPPVSGFIAKGTTGEIGYCVEVNAYRRVQVDDTGVTFGAAFYFKTYASDTETVGNQFCVPVEIYGVKGVQ